MTVRILFFAQAREKAGTSRLDLDLPEGSRVSDVLALVQSRVPALEALAAHLAVAVNGEVRGPGTPVPAGAEVALLPPVSGG
jgi:molybdopterin synthase catalytic subunit